MGSEATYPLGLRNGKLVHISDRDVPSGKACGCTCPHCGDLFVARKGKVRIHHFVHHTKGKKCGYSPESELHKFAKQRIQEEECLMFPGYEIWDEVKKEIRKSNPEKVRFSEVMAEKSKPKYRPDLTCYTEDGRKIYIEIFVSNKVKERKSQLLAEEAVPTIEIDLSFLSRDFDKAELDRFLFESAAASEWIFNSKSVEARRMHQEYLEKKEAADRAKEEEAHQKLRNALIEEENRRREEQIRFEKRLQEIGEPEPLPEIPRYGSYVYPAKLPCKYCGEVTDWVICYCDEEMGVCRPCLKFHNSDEEVEKRRSQPLPQASQP